MSINWEQEANAYKDDLMRDLIELLKIESVRDIEHKTADFPLGPGPAKALHKVLEFGQRDGFNTKNIKNVAGRIEFGQGDEILGVLAHVDVVPAGDGWETAPFEPVIKDGNIIARGTSDDKGPLIAAYYALKILKKLNIAPKQKIHFIIGTDEESEWVGLNEYLKDEPTPDYGFSPDAAFPIINGEKGIVSFVLTEKLTAAAPADYTLIRFQSGIRDNMVPHAATAVVKHAQDVAFEKAFQTYLTKNKLTGTITFADEAYTLELHGKGAHAAHPQEGRNGATFLGQFLKDFAFDANGATYITTIGTTLHEDVPGKKIGIVFTDDLMGPLTACPTVFDYNTATQTATITVNIRYPQGTDTKTIGAQMTDVLGTDFAVNDKPHQEVPHYVSGQDPLVKTLLDVYGDHTGLPKQEVIVGGGTYGRALKRGVAFGAQFPDTKDLMHQANEAMPIDEILKSTAIYADAIYRLTK